MCACVLQSLNEAIYIDTHADSKAATWLRVSARGSHGMGESREGIRTLGEWTMGTTAPRVPKEQAWKGHEET